MDDVPVVLRPMIAFLQRIYCGRVSDDTYDCVVFLLYEHFCDDHLAVVLSASFGKEYSVAYNDVLRWGGAKNSPANLEEVRTELESAGLNTFLDEE